MLDALVNGFQPLWSPGLIPPAFDPPRGASVGPRANDGGGYWLIELELIEPSLYLRTDPGAPARFAQALHERVNGAAFTSANRHR